MDIHLQNWGGRNCQSAFKFDPPCASKNDPPQVFVFKGTSGGAGMQLCKTGVFGNKAAQNALLVKIIFGSKVGIAFIYCQKNTRTKKGSQKGKKGDPKMRGGAIQKKKKGVAS